MYSVFHNAIRPRNKFHPRMVCSLMICNQKGAKKRPAYLPAKPLRKACQTPPRECNPKSHTPKRLCKACMIVSHTVKGVCRCCIVPPHTVKRPRRCCMVVSHTVKGPRRCCIVVLHTVKGPRRCCMVISHTVPAPRRCCTLISHTATACARDERDLSGWLPNGFAASGRSI